MNIIARKDTFLLMIAIRNNYRKLMERFMPGSIQQTNLCTVENKQFGELIASIKDDITIRTPQSIKAPLWANLKNIKNTLSSSAVAAKETLRTIDGIDEFATLAGAALSPLGQAVVLLSVVVGGLPFVALGAQGATEESIALFREQFPTMVENLLKQCGDIIDEVEKENILPAMQPVKDILLAIKDIRQIIENKSLIEPGSTEENDLGSWEVLNLLKDKGITEKNILTALESFSTFFSSCKNQYKHNSVAMHKIENFQRDIRDLPAELINRNFSPLAAIAMIGMTGGMVSLGAKSVADIISSTAGAAGIAENAAIASSGLATAAGAVFLPAQAAMIGYAVGCAIHGEMRDKNIKKDLVILLDLKDKNNGVSFSPETISYMCDHLVQQRNYNKQHSSIYGYVTTFGQSMMLLSTVCTLSGVGIVVALPLAAIGAPCTMWAAISRAVNKNKEEKFLGTKASNSAQAESASFINKINKKENAMPDIEKEINTQRRLVIRSKLHSIIDKVLENIRKKGGNPTEEYLQTEIRKEIDEHIKRKKSGFQLSHTTLLINDLVMMRKLFDNDYCNGFFEGDINQIQNKLNKNIHKDWDTSQLTLSDDRVKKIDKQVAEELRKVAYSYNKSSDDTTNESKQSGREDAHLDVINRILTTNLRKQLKTDSKSRLYSAINQFVPSWKVKIASTVAERVPDNTTPPTGPTMLISGGTGIPPVGKVSNSPDIMPDTTINAVPDKNDIPTAGGIQSPGKGNVHAEHVINRQPISNAVTYSFNASDSNGSIGPHLNFEGEQTTSTVTGQAQISFAVTPTKKVSSGISDRIKELNQRIEVKNKILQEQTEFKQQKVLRDARHFSVEK